MEGTEEAPKEDGKVLVKSKTFWVQVAATALYSVSILFGTPLSGEEQMALIGAGASIITIVLRYMNKDIKSVL